MKPRSVHECFLLQRKIGTNVLKDLPVQIGLGEGRVRLDVHTFTRDYLRVL
jgi:hypothetical protein